MILKCPGRTFPEFLKEINTDLILHPRDETRRITFCNWHISKLEQDESFFEKIIWTDEAHVSNDGVFNKHNHHYWSDSNPHEVIHRQRQRRFDFNVWVALLKNKVLAYEIFEENLNARRYLRILYGHVVPFMEEIPLVENEFLHFQHDGAPAHNAAEVSETLNREFGNNWIGNRGPIRWPARSPDLSPLDFFFWGFIKDKLYLNRGTL